MTTNIKIITVDDISIMPFDISPNIKCTETIFYSIDNSSLINRLNPSSCILPVQEIIEKRILLDNLEALIK